MIRPDNTIRVTEFLYALRLVIEASKKLTNEDLEMLAKITDEMEEIKMEVKFRAATICKMEID